MILQIIGGVAIAVDAFAAGWWTARKWPAAKPAEVATQVGAEVEKHVDQLTTDTKDVGKQVTETVAPVVAEVTHDAEALHQAIVDALAKAKQ
jgi:hypothetical protein